MFSANENLALRQHKRRITGYVESTIPESALDLGTTVMVMQISCKAPGCVPLETAIAVVFPRGQGGELIPGLEESRSGGTFKTKVLLPMSEVTREDVLDALPPQFGGGRRTMEKLCLRARDVMLAQITQIMNDEDAEGKRLMAEYLMGCLREYMDAGCTAPVLGEPFPPKPAQAESGGTAAENDQDGGKGSAGGTDDKKSAVDAKEKSVAVRDIVSSDNAAAAKLGVSGTGNFVIRRVLDDDGGGAGGGKEANAQSNGRKMGTKPKSPAPAVPKPTQGRESAKDWRRRQAVEREMNSALQSSSASGLVQRMSEREHAPGIRRPGCPCCDEDNPANVVDAMMML